MGLPTLEFSDSFLDGPEFRGRVQRHEEELERSNRVIKDIIRDGNTLIAALRTLSLAVQRFARSLQDFQFECIGDAETDDEINIAQSLKEFSQLLSAMEEERKRLIQNADDVLIAPLETFRREQIAAVKEGKKQFDKETERYYSVLEKHLSLSSRKKEAQLQEADSQMRRDRQVFFDASLQYVFKIQEVQERKKFEFVEPLLSFLQGLFTFYHEGYELASEFEPYKQQLQFNLQNARNNFESTRLEVERLMKRIRSAEEDFKAPSRFTMEGNLYVQEKRPLGSVWTRYYCTYEKSSKTFSMSNTEVRAASRQNGVLSGTPETFRLRSCVRRKTESIDKRFCFDVEVVERHGVLTLQALSEANRRLWMEAMDGKEPIYTLPSLLSKKEETFLNEAGFNFVKTCISLVESRGLSVLGLYRTAGVNSKVQRLMTSVFASSSPPSLLEAESWESKTITSGLKDYFRCLAEPVLTFRLHQDFIKAAKLEEPQHRVPAVHALVHRLPDKNRSMLELLTLHLLRVSSHSEQNLMSVSNLAMIFGPTLMRSQEETVAAMMDIKFQNIVVEILIEHHHQIFGSAPDLSVPLPQAPPPRSAPRRNKAICLSGRRRARLYPPTLCLADNHSDTFSSSSSSTPMGSRESLSSHSSEKNALSPTSSPDAAPGSSPNAVPGSSLITTGPSPSSAPCPSPKKIQPSPPALPSPPGPSNGMDGSASSSLPPPSSGTSSSLVAPPSSSSSLVAPPSSSSSSAVKEASLERASSFSEGGSAYSYSSSLDPRSSSSSTITEHQEAEPTRTSSKTASSSSSSSLCPSQLSSSSSLTSLHISEDYKSCHGSFQSLISVNESLNKRSSCSADLTRRRSAGSNGHQRAVHTRPAGSGYPNPRRESSVFSSALDLCSGRDAKALYSCEAEHSHELSFHQGALFSNVYPSVEPGWLQATFNGRTGLIPENYVTFV